jgi:CheY-like chemotaxis protein
LSSASTNGHRLVNSAAILCIDDEPDAIKIRKLLLESEGYRVFDATTGEEGLRLFREHKVDVVIVDYWMSGMNGLAVAREIKRLSPAMPIIMLSGFSELPGEAVGIADRWILKGRSTQDLLNAISTLTNGQSQD